MQDSMKLKMPIIQSFSSQMRSIKKILPERIFKSLEQINRKTSYQVEFDDSELVKHSVDYINEKLVVANQVFT